MRSLVLRPHAKINLGLRIVGSMPDGFHEVRTRFQSIDLTDELVLEEAPRELRLEVEGARLPADASNLVLRAARALRDIRPGLPGARILLKKRIPLAAGLGGGSSDAAATLLGLSRLWDLPLAAEDLSRMGSELGADVPYFLVGGAALGTGRGDRVVALPDPLPFRIALALPPLAVSTAEAYRLWDELSGSFQGRPRLEDFSGGNPAEEPSQRSVTNDLEAIAFSRHPKLGEFREILLRHGARAAALSGSGPSVYGLFDSSEEISALLADPAWDGVTVLECAPVGRSAYWSRLGLPLSD